MSAGARLQQLPPIPESAIAPTCSRCTRRHNPALRCWAGRYARAVTALVIATYGADCCHCHQPGATTSEHVRPRSRFGTDAIDNLRPAHKSCNSSRGVRPMTGWTDQPTTSKPW